MTTKAMLKVRAAAGVAQEAISIAKAHLENGAVMASSARSCVDDAMTNLGRGEHYFAAAWAKKSLAYSVGIFHADYVRVVSLIDGLDASCNASSHVRGS